MITVCIALDLTVGGLIEKTYCMEGIKKKFALKHTNNYKYLRHFERYHKMLKSYEYVVRIQSDVMTKQARGKIVYTISNLYYDANT